MSRVAACDFSDDCPNCVCTCLDDDLMVVDRVQQAREEHDRLREHEAALIEYEV